MWPVSMSGCKPSSATDDIQKKQLDITEFCVINVWLLKMPPPATPFDTTQARTHTHTHMGTDTFTYMLPHTITLYTFDGMKDISKTKNYELLHSIQLQKCYNSPMVQYIKCQNGAVIPFQNGELVSAFFEGKNIKNFVRKNSVICQIANSPIENRCAIIIDVTVKISLLIAFEQQQKFVASQFLFQNETIN